MAVAIRRMLAALACSLIFACTVFWCASSIRGEGLEFRVDTELFKNEEKSPILQQLTIFTAEGAVYDFCLTAPTETTVFDPRHGRFTLLDESRKKKALITTQELLDYSLALEAHAAKQKDQLFAFCAAAKFETTEKEVDLNGQTHTELRLAAKSLTYTALGLKPPQPEAAKVYRHFADWCARLNSSRAGNLPANARLLLNNAFAERDLLPFEITRTTAAATPFGKKLDLRSEHRFNWALSGEDRKKIGNAGDMIATYELVSYDEYRAADAKPLPSTTSKSAAATKSTPPRKMSAASPFQWMSSQN